MPQNSNEKKTSVNTKPDIIANGRQKPDDALNLVFIARTLIDRRKMLLRNTILAGVLFFILSFLLPKSYKAHTSLLPPNQQDFGAITKLLDQLPLIALPIQGNRNASELFIEILGSRTVGETVLQAPISIDSTTTNLFDYWESASVEKALKRLYRNTTFATSEQGIIEIDVEIDHPEVAAQVANAFVAALDKVNQQRNASRAQATRKYIESQLAITSGKLKVATDSLAWYQSQYQAVSLEEQARALFEQAGVLKGQIIAKQVELQLLRNTMKKDNPALLKAERVLKALENQYALLQKSDKSAVENQDFIMPAADMPEVAKRLASLMREVKAQETVWEYLTQQYHQAKIQEARDTPTVQVLDPAVPPESPSWPRPILMTLTGAFSVLILSMVFAILFESVFRNRNVADGNHVWRRLWNEVKQDFARGKAS